MFSTDPRDKIYGLLELMAPSLERLITPSYTAPVSTVYIDFAQAAIADNGLLDVMRLHYQREHRAALMGPRLDGRADQLPTQRQRDHLPRQRPLRRRAHLPGNILSCTGFRRDGIDGTGALWSKQWSAASMVNATNSDNPYGSPEATREAAWKTMTSARDMNSKPITDSYADIVSVPALAKIAADIQETSPLKEVTRAAIFTYTVTILAGNHTFRVRGREMQSYFLQGLPREKDAVRLRDALMQVDRVANRRMLFTMQEGYLGVAMESLAREDAVYILLGCTMPVVLRDLDDGTHFQYVGSAMCMGLWTERRCGGWKVGIGRCGMC